MVKKIVKKMKKKIVKGAKNDMAKGKMMGKGPMMDMSSMHPSDNKMKKAMNYKY